MPSPQVTIAALEESFIEDDDAAVLAAFEAEAEANLRREEARIAEEKAKGNGDGAGNSSCDLEDAVTEARIHHDDSTTEASRATEKNLAAGTAEQESGETRPSRT